MSAVVMELEEMLTRLKPEAAEKLGSTPYLWTERVGRGRVIAFAQDPVYRDMFRGQLPIFANAVFLGGTF